MFLVENWKFNTFSLLDSIRSESRHILIYLTSDFWAQLRYVGTAQRRGNYCDKWARRTVR